jgi:4-hydroxybenzoate polyprenyltransferase
MFESFILLVLVALFGFGYGTRSYIGVLVPGVLFVCAVIIYRQHTPTGDEVDVQPAIYVFATGIGVVLYLAGVALGRPSPRSSSGGAEFR